MSTTDASTTMDADCENAFAIHIRHGHENDLPLIAEFDEMGGSRQQEIATECCLVAEHGGETVAYASFQPAGLLGQPLLTYLCVASDLRGQGIGGRLVEAIQQIARGRMMLSSTEDWCVASQRIFIRLGWRKIGELAGVNKDGSTEYFYAIDLSPN
ncbi:GNAT family N-acetyltransferase [Chromobacterium vaccinii]|uniref:GNAT family N-acetyltransferase n=1 Tax=Chromobacterium vaccinii TaxID=1108595 RepID=UPI001E633E3C|nr:GNAT family N-acetyltransferase [Chromobacterium vaccinii]MCD4502195.1 GNAT family N-acetyltransferase [Chromobacterium vaccinii]